MACDPVRVEPLSPKDTPFELLNTRDPRLLLVVPPDMAIAAAPTGTEIIRELPPALVLIPILATPRP